MLRRLLFSIWYLRKPPWDTGISPPELLEFIGGHTTGRALDLGCGTGTNVITLAKNGWETTGIDFVPFAIQVARKKAQRAGVHVDLRVQDVSHLEGIIDPFDLVLDIGCLHSLPPQSKGLYIDHLPSLLAIEGTYLLYTFLKDSDNSGIGLTAEDLEQVSSLIDVVERKDGTERGTQPSAWFTFRRCARQSHDLMDLVG